MSDEAGLLRAIIEAPEEEASRLVYADWLAEHNGAPEAQARAEPIRLQCHLARFRHSEDVPFESGIEAGRLLPRHRQAFLAPLLALGLSEAMSRYHNGSGDGFLFTFRRGFVEDIEVMGNVAAARFLDEATKVFSLTPLRHLRFYPERMTQDGGAFSPVRLATLAALVRLPEVARLRALDLRGHGLGDSAAWTLLGSPHLRPQTLLLVGDNRIGPDAQQALRERFGNAVSFSPSVPPRQFEDDIPF